MLVVAYTGRWNLTVSPSALTMPITCVRVCVCLYVYNVSVSMCDCVSAYLVRSDAELQPRDVLKAFVQVRLHGLRIPCLRVRA